MKKKLIGGVAAAAVILIAATFSAVSGDGGELTQSQEKTFHALDANGDGKVTEKEFVITGLHEIFLSFDLDGNGKVSRKEFRKATRGHDIDADAEWAAMSRGSDEITFKDSLRNKVAIVEMKDHFEKLDRNGKGYVTLKDLN